MRKMEIFNKPESKEKRKHLRKNSTKAESILWEELRGKKLLGAKFKRQFSVDKYVIDFYCPKLNLAIELDGEIHLEKVAIKYDKVRTLFLNNLGIEVIRFNNEEIFESLPLVLERIKDEILKLRSN
ncbi:MAG: endonuclease domain-containing protein [Bacteroidetes bacterium]|nr:endonuclease domain-containing protein [Bacteroidota bacterium]